MKANSCEEKAVDSKIGRFALCLSYSGTSYHGWQSQRNNLPTIQSHLESALSKVANHSVEVVCAGRTDKGVHGSHQVVHFDSDSLRSERAWVFGANSNLPRDISVSRVFEVDQSFHARFSAESRRYHYLIYNHPVRPAIFGNEVTWSHDPLVAEDMHSAAQCLVGEHDFTSFRASGCQSKSPFRFIEFVKVSRFSDMIVIDIKGNAFLHHMVRNIAGVLMDIGKGRRSVDWCAEVLSARDRKRGSVTAPPNGLYLTHVAYPVEYSYLNALGSAPSIVDAMISRSNRKRDNDLWQISRL